MRSSTKSEAYHLSACPSTPALVIIYLAPCRNSAANSSTALAPLCTGLTNELALTSATSAHLPMCPWFGLDRKQGVHGGGVTGDDIANHTLSALVGVDRCPIFRLIRSLSLLLCSYTGRVACRGRANEKCIDGSGRASILLW